jgi:hypothetical protein
MQVEPAPSSQFNHFIAIMLGGAITLRRVCMKVKYVSEWLLLSFAGIVCCIGLALSGDVNLKKQVRENKGETANGGVVLADTESATIDPRVARTKPGFWKGMPNKIYTASFTGKKEGKVIAIVEFQGTVRWDAEGKITTTEEGFRAKRVRSEKFPADWQDVAGFKLQEGKMRVGTIKGEVFLFSELKFDFVGSAERVY